MLDRATDCYSRRPNGADTQKLYMDTNIRFHTLQQFLVK